MPRPRKVANEIKLLIAQMYGEQHMSNQAIAKALCLSESAVSKAIRENFDQGRLSLSFNRDGLTTGELSYLQQRSALVDGLHAQVARLPKHPSAVVVEPDIRLFDSGGSDTTQEAWATRLATFGSAAAPYVLHLISKSRIVGTSWGATLSSVIRGLQPPPKPFKPAIEFVPLCPEMLDGPPRKASASNLAYRLDETVNDDMMHRHSYWLAGIPSHVPLPVPADAVAPPGRGKFTKREQDVIRAYVRSLPAHRQVFGMDRGSDRDPSALISRLDMVLTSCGSLESDGVRWLRSTGLSSLEAKALVVGDVTGILLDRALPGNGGARRSSRASTRVAEINDAWMGVREGDLRRCCARALGGSGVGVVLCCIGANKSDALREILVRGLASRVVMDYDCAQRLAELLPRD